jgi:hypothetical protein
MNKYTFTRSNMGPKPEAKAAKFAGQGGDVDDSSQFGGTDSHQNHKPGKNFAG